MRNLLFVNTLRHHIYCFDSTPCNWTLPFFYLCCKSERNCLNNQNKLPFLVQILKAKHRQIPRMGHSKMMSLIIVTWQKRLRNRTFKLICIYCFVLDILNSANPLKKKLCYHTKKPTNYFSFSSEQIPSLCIQNINKIVSKTLKCVWRIVKLTCVRSPTVTLEGFFFIFFQRSFSWPRRTFENNPEWKVLTSEFHVIVADEIRLPSNNDVKFNLVV